MCQARVASEVVGVEVMWGMMSPRGPGDPGACGGERKNYRDDVGDRFVTLLRKQPGHSREWMGVGRSRDGFNRRAP